MNTLFQLSTPYTDPMINSHILHHIRWRRLANILKTYLGLCYLFTWFYFYYT